VAGNTKQTLTQLAKATTYGDYIDASNDAAIPSAFGRAAEIMCSVLDSDNL
jgi:hypothetical protein